MDRFGAQIGGDSTPLPKWLGRRIPLPSPSGTHLVATIFSALALALLITAYVVIVGATALYALDYFAGHVAGLIKAGPSADIFAYIFFGFLVASAALLLLKPALRFERAGVRPLSVSRREEPGLYRFVESLCWSINAPAPQTIYVTPGAEVSTKGSFFGLLFGKYDLVVGLTLAHDTDLRRFTAALAEELVRRRRRTFWRLDLFVSAVNAWFARGVLDRDVFDERLRLATQSRSRLVRLGAKSWRVNVGAGRTLLALFRKLARVAGAMSSRLADYENDGAAARIAGSAAVAEMLECGALLSMVSTISLDRVSAGRHEALADDLPAVIVDSARRLVDRRAEMLEAMLRHPRTKWSDIHPSLNDRILLVEHGRFPGLDFEPRPAATLFADHARLSRAATFRFYEQTVRAGAWSGIVPARAVILGRDARPEAVSGGWNDQADRGIWLPAMKRHVHTTSDPLVAVGVHVGVHALGHVAVHAAVSLMVAGGSFTGARVVTQESPRYYVLPRSESYQSTMVPPSWTPPTGYSVWNQGTQPYDQDRPRIVGYRTEFQRDENGFTRPVQVPVYDPTGPNPSDPTWRNTHPTWMATHPEYDSDRGNGGTNGGGYDSSRSIYGGSPRGWNPGARKGSGYENPPGYQPPGYRPPTYSRPDYSQPYRPPTYSPPSYSYSPPSYSPPSYSPPSYRGR